MGRQSLPDAVVVGAVVAEKTTMRTKKRDIFFRVKRSKE